MTTKHVLRKKPVPPDPRQWQLVDEWLARPECEDESAVGLYVIVSPHDPEYRRGREYMVVQIIRDPADGVYYVVEPTERTARLFGLKNPRGGRFCRRDCLYIALAGDYSL